MLIQARNGIEISEVVERFITSLMRTECDPTEIFTGVNNAFAHGEILTEMGWDFSEEQLSELYKGVEMCLNVCKDIANDK